MEADLAREKSSSQTVEIVYRLDAARRPRRRAPRTPAEAQQRLLRGNRTFAELLDTRRRGTRVIPLDPIDLGHGAVFGVAPVQRPFAAVVGCSDARVPIEMVFQQRANDLFVVRVAGNGVGSGCLGSLRYAADKFSSLKLVVVLGHSQCGAVSAAVDTFLRPKGYLLLAGNHALRSIVDSLLVAVRSASLALERARGPRVSRLRGYRAALVEVSVALNAAVVAFTLREELESRSCRVLFGCYDLASRYVRFPRSASGRGQPAEAGLLPPPRSDDEFRAFATRLAGSAEVSALLRSNAPGG